MKQSRLTHRSRVTSLESRTTFVQCLFACLPCFCQAPGMSLALLLLWKVRGHQLQSSCNNTSCLGRMFSFHWYNPRVAIIYNAKTVSRRADVKPKGKYPAAGLLQKSFHSLETMNHSIFIQRYVFFSELIYLLIQSVGEEETRWKGGNMFVNFYCSKIGARWHSRARRLSEIKVYTRFISKHVARARTVGTTEWKSRAVYGADILI